jgi:NTE family protein
MLNKLAPVSAFVALLTLWLSSAALAQPAAPTHTADAGGQRPRIGLVLSGGGARGLAHLGVLRALRELRVPVDLVVGTSMGAVVGGAYAAGRSIEEIEEIVHSADWATILSDRPQRRELSFTRREEDQLLPSRIEMGLNRNGVSLPPAAVGNSALERTLERLISGQRADLPLNQLALPFRALATDLLSGEMHEMIDTPLFLALRASMAVPGVFAPVRIQGRPMVDGGLVRNLGVDIARKMGADIIIAVNVGSPLLEERELGSAVGVANQMLQILTEQNVTRSLKELRPADVLIDPQLDSMGFLDFQRLAPTVEVGHRAALAAQERLQQLALTDADYSAYQQSRLPLASAQPRALPLQALSIKGTRRSNPQALQSSLGLQAGEPVTEAQVERAAAVLYGSGDFDRVDTAILDSDGRRQVTLQVNEAAWARSRLRVGLELYSNFDDANRFSLVAMHSANWLNPWGAELRSLGRIGAKRELGTELLQPLGPGSDLYLAPRLHYEESEADTFEGGRRVARYAVNLGTASLSLGWRLGNWGDVRLGTGRVRSRTRAQLPEDPSLGSVRLSLRTHYAQLRIDSLDSMAFPARGQLLNLSYARLDSDRTGSINQVSALGLSAFQLGHWAGHLYGEYSHASIGNTSSLGGFLRLSGSPDSSLEGRNLFLGRLVMAKRIGQMPLGLGQSVRVGFSLELGGAVPEQQTLQAGDLKLAGSGFLAVDTRFGPFYLALGGTREGKSAVYLFLGPVW